MAYLNAKNGPSRRSDGFYLVERPVDRWTPRHTSPMPPRPMGLCRSNRPSESGGAMRPQDYTRGDQRAGGRQGAQRTGATGTPAFYIEGMLLPGAYPMPIFRQVLDSIYAAKTGK